MAKEVVAGLLDHVLHADESRLIVIKRLLQGFDGFVDLFPVLAGRPAPLLRTYEARGEDGLD